MGLREIEAKILGEAEARAVQIKKEGEKERAALEAAAQKKAEAAREEILAEARQLAEEEKKAVVVPARLLMKQRILEEKHRLLEEVFAGIPPAVREAKESEVVKLLYG